MEEKAEVETLEEDNPSLNIIQIVVGIVALIVIVWLFLFNNGKSVIKTSEVSDMESKNSQSISKEASCPECKKCTTYADAWGFLREYYSAEYEESGWVKLQSYNLGLSFDYPIPANSTVSFELKKYGENDTDPSGNAYIWEITNSIIEEGYKHGFAGGISENFSEGRDRWATDFFLMEEEDGNYYRKTSVNTRLKINPLKVFTSKYNTKAILYNVEEIIFPGQEDYDKDKAIILNLPFKDSEFKGFAIYFINGVSEADAQRVVSSIELR